MNPIVALWMALCLAGTLVNAAVLVVALRAVRSVRNAPEDVRKAWFVSEKLMLLVAHTHVRNAIFIEVGLIGGLLAGAAVWLDDPLHPSTLLVNIFVWGLMCFPAFLTIRGAYSLFDSIRARRALPVPNADKPLDKEVPS